MPDKQNKLIEFFRGTGTDSEGRSLKDIRAWDYEQLEHVHNYIQWVFPLSERSHYNMDAPILKSSDIETFLASSQLRQELLNNLDTMLGFYGFIRYSDQIVPSSIYPERIKNWLSFRNHNFLRISRILKCLKCLGLDKEAQQFFHALKKIHPQFKTEIGNSFYYWQQSIFKNEGYTTTS